MRLALAALLLCTLGCRESEPEQLLRAKRVTNANDLIGGPLAHGQVDDYLIENDKVRFIITGAHHSWGPGLFGGTVVDADRRRDEPFYRGVEGNDHFAELFPTVNLIVPDPTFTQFEVVKDGSDGKEAIIEVEGSGVMFLDALKILDPTVESTYQTILANADLKTVLNFKTTYTLRPGLDYLEITTTATRPDFVLHNEDDCGGPFECELECPNGHLRDKVEGCLICECDEGLPMDQFDDPVPLLSRILGGVLASEQAPGLEAGLIGGDFMFFGGGTNIFAPGIGFDEKGEIFANLFRGIDTITSPLTFDWVAGVADDVSYGLFTKRADPCEDPADCPQKKLLVPLATSSATMLSSAALSCKLDSTEDPNDDETCDSHRSFSFTRYLAVGDGDVASVASTVYEAQGITTGRVHGAVLDSRFGRAEARADVFALVDPDPDAEFASYDAVIQSNLKDSNRVGVVSHTKADIGTDPERNGRYDIELPAGSWFLVARSKSGVVGTPVRVNVTAGGNDVVHLLVEPPAFLDYRIVGNDGGLIPAKVTLQAICEDGSAQAALGACDPGDLLHADGKRRVALGDGRLDDGIFKVLYSAQGHGKEAIEPGRYRVVVSRGFEYGIHTEDIILRGGEITSLAAVLTREIDSTGWISGDFHLHAEPSHDSGLTLGLRTLTNIVEGVELLSSSDHDVVTDYGPALLELGLQAFATTQVGLEITTIELGHTLGFPLRYNHKNEPVHGAIDWVCKTHQELFDEVRALGEFGPDNTLAVIAHPRDGFLGYFDQFDLDPWTGERGGLGLESNNPLFKTLSCDFDAIELLNGKRFELIRTPTVSEINDAQKCLDEITGAADADAVTGACTWLRQPEECADSETRRGEPCSWYADADAGFATCRADDALEVCKDRVRNSVTKLIIRRMLYRTPEEQLAFQNATEAERDSDTTECAPSIAANLSGGDDLEEARSIAPCAQHQGVTDDWFTLLNHGMNVAQMGNSDSHGTTSEPGIPRTWIKSSTDDASRIDKLEIAKNLKAARAVSSTGPFVRFSIGDAGIGDTTAVQGDTVQAHIQIQTASWFGVSRIEIYRNGTLEKAIDVDKPAAEIVDFDEVVELDKPAEDSWYVVTTFGLRDQDFLDPVYHTEALGQLSFDKITSLAFANLGVIGSIIGTSSLVVDYFPTVPYAITNPIWVDVDGGGFTPPKGDRPGFCPQACTTDEDCPREGYICHDNKAVNQPGDGGTCGPDIKGSCGLEIAERASALTVEGKGGPLARLRTRHGSERDKELLQHALGRRLFNAFVHGPHGRRD